MVKNWKLRGRKIRIKGEAQEQSPSKHSKVPLYLAVTALLGLGGLFLNELTPKPSRKNMPVVQQPEKKDPTTSILSPATTEELFEHNKVYQSQEEDPKGHPFRNTATYARLPNTMKHQLIALYQS